MATKLLDMEAINRQRIHQFEVFDDFMMFTDKAAAGTTANSQVGTVDWMMVSAAASNTAGIDTDAPGGQLVLTTDNEDNDEIYLYTKHELFNAIVDKPLYVGMRAKVAAVTDNYAAVVFGMFNAPAAATLVDDTFVPASSKYHACFYKPSDAAALKVSSVGTNITDATTYNQDTTEISAHSENWCQYGILIEPVSTTDKRITYYFHDEGSATTAAADLAYKYQLRDSNNYPLQHIWSLADVVASTGAMSLLAGVKTGSAEAQTLTIDWIGGWQLRT